MTLLGILFVLGVAFLGTMNFEASMIAAETTRSRGQDGVKGVAESVGSMMRDGVMFNGSTPFGGGALSSNSFAELPGYHNQTSPIEPFRDDNGTPTPSDDRVLYPWFTDLATMQSQPFNGTIYPREYMIDTSWAPGSKLGRCNSGARINGACLGLPDCPGVIGGPPGVCVFRCEGGPTPNGQCQTDADCSDYPCVPIAVLTDADGDGISDSIQVEASVLKLSASQMSELSARLNPASNPGGKVYVGMRIIPHTGLANLNQSHPYLIREALGLATWPAAGDPPDPNLGDFVHRPTQFQELYAPSQDEATIRHRGGLLPRLMTPSRLFGDPSLNQSANPTGLADMQWQLFAPVNVANSEYESAFERIGTRPAHRYWNYRTDEFWADNPDNPPTWAVRMEPSTSESIDPSGVEYDRRHLVTTVSHDDLENRGGRVPIAVTVPLPPTIPPTPPITQTEDILAAMREANLSMWDPTNPSAIPRVRPPVVSYPFEYPDYPQTIVNPPNGVGDSCTVSDPNCKTNPRKGRLQLSLAWLDSVFSDDGNDTNDQLPKVARDRLIYDAFLMLVNNASGVYWEDVPCTPGGNQCPAFEECRNIAGTPPLGICRDRVTNQRHRANLITRTAAALTANMLDFADLECLGGARDGQGCRFDADCGGSPCIDRALPTRVALRSFDFVHSVCLTRNGQELIAPVTECTIGSTGPSTCPANYDCVRAAKSVGREFDIQPNPDRYGNPPPTDEYDPVYVYGIEKQPFITEVASHAENVAPHAIDARAIELFNPYDRDFQPADRFWIVEYEGAVEMNRFAIPQPIVSGANPFTVLIWSRDTVARGTLLGAAHAGPTIDVGALQFQPGWTVYLVKQVQYPEDRDTTGSIAVTDIVVDQFTIPDIATDPQSYVGRDNPPVTPDCITQPCLFSRERVATATTTGRWTGLIPLTTQGRPAIPTLGDWSQFNLNTTFHPVEIPLPNLGTFTKPFSNPLNPLDPSVSFPTTGSMLMLPRHANGALPKLTIPPTPLLVTELAFTTRLNDTTNVAGGLPPLLERDQIDNGRMPVFDQPVIAAGNLAAHHDVSPAGSTQPGDLNELPWGQLVFDYFTVLPLSNAGPYLVNDINLIGLPDSQPRVDLEGLRVHGRINVNAVPATVLAGLPYVPMQKVPVDFRQRIHDDIGVDPAVTNTDAWTLGPYLADSIVAYRELRPIVHYELTPVQTTGNYKDGTPLAPPPNDFLYGRGLGLPTALARRGSGLMSVGELANIRHFGVGSGFRFDGAKIDLDPANNNTQNFIDAIATLYALGDWVTVRSQVFTVYGVLRGDTDPSIVDSDPFTQAQLQAQDVDSRAIRFQETIDRLPTILGEPLPTRIGQRSVGRYTDVRND